MPGSFRRRGCTCPETQKKCTCGATWSFRLSAGKNPKTGKYDYVERNGFKTKREAELAAAKLYAELKEGTYVKENNSTFEEFSREWLSMYKATGKVKISTVRVREHEIDKLSPYFAKLRMKDITKKRYQNALNDLKETKGFADNTLDGIHRTGRMIFKKAAEMDVIKIDPTQYAHVPKVQKTVEELEKEEATVKYLEKEELALFLKTAKDKGLDRDYLIFKTLAYTGMRIGELCALKWADIDFEEHTLSISKTYYNPINKTTEYTLLTPKTKSARRTIELDVTLLEELKSYQEVQKSIQLSNLDTYHNKDFVFAKTKKNPGYPELIKVIQIRMARLLKLADLNENLTPHSLRHTHTSLLAEAGVGLQEIMDRLGHKDDDTTKHVYLHVTKPKKKEASQKFSELMESL
ncbi:tyrosine-type recombinase/integrase [Paenibacillus sp. LX16]|uniref:tyrosine-type recombinase/integrase n=1 Tax=Paenibacillus sp. LX16 TaxID=1740264 RepID=UPI002E2DB888|nr:tyrosine-type recombinase/integrase [Paenibacillus sp. LX16]